MLIDNTLAFIILREEEEVEEIEVEDLEEDALIKVLYLLEIIIPSILLLSPEEEEKLKEEDIEECLHKESFIAI
jgi:hypothetical protein